MKIDTDMFIVALKDNSYEREYFLDKRTGQIEMLMDSSYSPDDDEVGERVESEPERYITIEPVGSDVGFQIMEEFVSGLSEGDARNNLVHALNGNKPFRRFKDVLLDYPGIRENWFSFHNQRFKTMIREWLEDHGIAAELLPAPGEQNSEPPQQERK